MQIWNVFQFVCVMEPEEDQDDHHLPREDQSGRLHPLHHHLLCSWLCQKEDFSWSDTNEPRQYCLTYTLMILSQWNFKYIIYNHMKRKVIYNTNRLLPFKHAKVMPVMSNVARNWIVLKQICILCIFPINARCIFAYSDKFLYNA